MNVIRSKSINIHSSLWKNSKIIVKKKLNYKQMVDFRFEIRCDTSLYIDWYLFELVTLIQDFYDRFLVSNQMSDSFESKNFWSTTRINFEKSNFSQIPGQRTGTKKTVS